MRKFSRTIGAEKTWTNRQYPNGVYDLSDVYNYRLADNWPYVQEYTSYSLSPGHTVSEGSDLTLTVYTVGYEDGESIYYSINTTSGPTITGADFSDGTTSGSITVTNNVGTITKSLVATDTEEFNTMTIDIRKEATTGPIFATTSTITITDVENVVGQQNFTSTGSSTWTAPAGVTSVCVLCIGGGGGGRGYYTNYAATGGGGGGLGYRNNITVVPGQNYTVYVGPGGSGGNYYAVGQNDYHCYYTMDNRDQIIYSAASDGGGGGGSSSSFNSEASDTVAWSHGGASGGNGNSGGQSYFSGSGITTTYGYGGTGGNYYNSSGGGYSGDGGGNGGYGYRCSAYDGASGGGGAGGYSGTGGQGRQDSCGGENGYSGSGGAGGGGGCNDESYNYAGYGGGVGIYGQGANGGGGNSGNSYTGQAGSMDWGGSSYGRGGRGSTNYYGGAGGNGCVRIIWGNGRSYPSTLTTDQ